MAATRFRTSAVALLFAVAFHALVAGFLLMRDASGALLGLTTHALRFSGLSSFFLPGLILFVANGVLALVTALAVLRRWRYYPVRLAAQGFLLTGWIGIQVILLREFNALHALLGAIGLFWVCTGVGILRQGAGQ